MSNWKTILKKVSEREQLDAEEFAPEAMQEWRDERANDSNLYLLKKFAKRFDTLELYIESGDASEEVQEILTLMLKKGRKFIDIKDGKSAQRQWKGVLLILREEETSPFKR